MEVDFERELGKNLKQYRALLQISEGAPANSVLGHALDEAAGTLAVHVAALTDKHGLTGGYMELIFDFQLQRYGGGARDSVALAPVLALIYAKAEPERIADRLILQNRLKGAVEEGNPQRLAEAEKDLEKLLNVTGDGGVWGDVFYAASRAGEFYVEELKSDA